MEMPISLLRPAQVLWMVPCRMTNAQDSAQASRLLERADDAISR